MLTKETYENLVISTLAAFEKAKIAVTAEEKEHIEVTDFGLNRPYEIGLQLLVYINTERYCAKEMALLPKQICPEHRHPPIGEKNGKQETFRCRYGDVFLYVEGSDTTENKGCVPADKQSVFQVWHEIHLTPGMQYTILPNTWHWFQGGEAGAIVSEFSTSSTDENDIFRDPEIQRIAVVEDA